MKKRMFFSILGLIMAMVLGQTAAVAAGQPRPVTSSGLDKILNAVAAEDSPVIQGQVTHLESFGNQWGWIYTIATITVEKQLSGSAVDREIFVRYNGGTISDTTFYVDTEPQLRVGDKIEVALAAGEDNTYRILNGRVGVIFLGAPAVPEYAFLGRWSNEAFPVPYYINQNGTPDTEGEFEAVQAAYNSWNNVACSSADFAYQGTTAAQPGSRDYLNVVGWLPDAQSPCPGVIGCAPLWLIDGRLIESDIVFNENKNYSIGGTYDVQALVTHEGGHDFGLDHSTDPNAVMNAHFPGGTRWRVLTPDDINGICALYALTIPTSQNIVLNSDFGTNDLTNWWAGGDVDWAFYGNHVLYFKRRATPNGGNVGQNWNYFVPANSPLEVRLQLGNTSGVTKVAGVFLRSGEHWDLQCWFSIPAGSPLQTYVMRGRNSVDWYQFNIEVWPDPPDGIPDVTMDNVSVQYRPDINPTGTECFYGNQPPALPTLSSPAEGENLASRTVTFRWIAGADDGIPNPTPDFRIQIDDSQDFSSPIADTGWRYTELFWTTTLPEDGSYYWRVSQGDGDLNSGWANPSLFMVDTVAAAGFCDDFDGTLNAGWQWIDPLGDSSYSLVITPGYLRLYTPDGEHDLYMNMNAPRLLQPITGDFTVTTRLTIHPQYNYQGAGILVWEDENNFIRLERTLVRGVNLGYRINGVFGEIAEIPFSSPTVQLKLQRRGNDFTAWYRDDATDWLEAGTVSYPASADLQVGLSLLNNWQDNPIWVDYDYFQVNPCPANVSYVALNTLVAIYPNTAAGSLAPADVTLVQESILKAVRFMWQHAHFKLLFNVTFLVIDDYKDISEFTVNESGGYWLYPTDDDGDSVSVETDLLARGVLPNQYDSINYLWAHNNGSLPAQAGGMAMVMYWQLGCSGLTMDPIFQESGATEYETAFTHEVEHVISFMFSDVGYPDYFNADRPWELPGAFGGGWSFWAYGMEHWPVYGWLALPSRWGDITQAPDMDGDGVPDYGTGLPMTELSLGSSPNEIDSDGDGLSDLGEAVAGIFDNANPSMPDTDQDEALDGLDPEPMYAIHTQILSKTHVLDGEPAGWDRLYSGIASASTPFSYTVYANWDSQNLYLMMIVDRYAGIHLNVDANADGWFHGRDNYQLGIDPSYSDPHDWWIVGEAHIWDCSPELIAIENYPLWDNDQSYPFERLIIESSIGRYARSYGDGFLVQIAIPYNARTGMQPQHGKRIGLKLTFDYIERQPGQWARAFEQDDWAYVTLWDSASIYQSYLPLLISPEIDIPVSSVLTPFDADVEDLFGPGGWDANYGKISELIVASNGVELDVFAQDYNPETAWNAVLLHIKRGSNGYRVSQALTNIPMLDRVMGLAIDEAGNRYYATGVDETELVDPYYPPPDTYRSDIVRVVKLDPAGNALFNIDLDLARHAFDDNAEMIINPTVVATSRLAVGGNEIALVHGNNTAAIDGVRHQKALSTRLDATTGAVIRASSVWVSHSFDQRLLYDGHGIIEHHLADAAPRYLVFDRNHESYPLFHIKGPFGENLTATRLGNIALIENDPAYGYLALFATESTTIPGNIFDSKINGPRNLAIVRVNRSDNSIDPNLPDTLTVISAGVEQTNHLKWLTDYTTDSNLHAERPKLIGIGGDQYIVLWEEWFSIEAVVDTFHGVYGMVIDGQGNILRAATLLTSAHHLPRGDDAFFLDQRAAWMTGNRAEQKLYIHFVDADLNYELVILD